MRQGWSGRLSTQSSVELGSAGPSVPIPGPLCVLTGALTSTLHLEYRPVLSGGSQSVLGQGRGRSESLGGCCMFCVQGVFYVEEERCSGRGRCSRSGEML